MLRMNVIKTEKNNVCNNREQFDVFNAIMMLCTLACKKCEIL